MASMSQLFQLALLDAGANRLAVIARIRPLLNLPPSECLSRIDSGPVVVAQNLNLFAAERLESELRNLGAAAKIAICECGCRTHVDH